MDLSLFGIVNNIKKLSNNNNNNEKFGNCSNGTKNLSTTDSFLIIIAIVISLVIIIWTIYALATFKLPQEILILCIILLFLTGPIIPLVLAYIFKNKQLK